MAEDTEVPVENAPKTEIIPDQNIDTEEIDKQEVCVNEAESSLIEDQTMPSYLSITSNGSSLKPDNSKVEPESHDEDIKPVYDVSSGDEDQQSNRHYDDDDDDEDEDDEDEVEYDEDGDEYDDEDEIDEEYEDYMNSDGVSHRNGMRREMRYQDESEENVWRKRAMRYHDETDDDDCEEDETDGDIEPEQFERSSDDFVVRTSNSNLAKLHIERSRSLQELSSPKKSPRLNSKRQTLINPFKFDTKYNIFEHNELKQRSSPMSRHNHGYSKIKYSIEERREQNKQLSPQKSDNKVNFGLYTVDADQTDIIQETDNLRPNPQCRRLKSYAEATIKDIMTKEDLTRQSINITNDLSPLINGDEMISIDAMEQHHERTIDGQETMEIDEENTQYANCNKQITKSNGMIEYSTINTDIEVEQKENGIITQLEPLINGEIISDPIVDVQTLSYDSYMKGNIDNNEKSDEILDDNIKKCINVNEVIINTMISSPDKMENIIPDELPLGNKIDVNNEPEIASVKPTKIEKSVEFNEEIRNENYQRIMNENFELKKQIEELQKILANQQKKMKEVKIAAVQTENQPRLMKHTSTTTHLQLPEKLSASTIPDIGSTLSSIENWTDSEYSPVVSLKPPNVDHILNSDQSTNQTTPRNPSQTSSRALWTTNRILQTLANLTPSRARPNLAEKKFDVPGQSKDTISPLISGGQNFRKRKASDNIGTSVFGPLPNKIPFTNKSDASRKFNSASDTDAAIKSTGLSFNSAAADQSEKVQDESQQNNNDETEEDDIKCFVWHENDNTQERSCLIQAPIESSTKVAESKKAARECGPYLLGNLEVRITEANGTLNIWGKEVNPDSSLKESDVINKEQNESNDNSKNFWPKTPRTMTNNQFKCSTNKKIKTPSTVRANISRHLRGMLNRTPSPVNIPVENHSDNHSNLYHRHNDDCDSYHSHKRLLGTVCRNHTNLQTKSTCCAYKPETNIHDCGCRRAHEQIIESNHCHCEMLHHCVLPSSNLNRHCGNIRQNHFDFDRLTAEKDCKHPACHRLSDTEFDDCCRHVSKKRCQAAEIDGCNHHVEKICCQEMNACSTHSSSEEVDPVVNFEKSDEVREKRHRLRGKRVRNFMGFLKGCSDCQNPETSSIDSCQIPETETTNTRSIPSIRVISDQSSSTSYRKKFNNSQNHKGCNSCIKHAGRAAELEAELEIMRVEISKLHSRSNAMRDMLHRVLQTDSNTAP